MTDAELAAAWNLWFSLAQTTNDSDPPYTHGVFVNVKRGDRTPTSHPPTKVAAISPSEPPKSNQIGSVRGKKNNT